MGAVLLPVHSTCTCTCMHVFEYCYTYRYSSSKSNIMTVVFDVIFCLAALQAMAPVAATLLMHMTAEVSLV